MPRKKKIAAKPKLPPQTKLTEITSNPFPPGLERPWPSPPAVPPRVHLFARFPYDQPVGEARLMSCGFVGWYAAKRWVEYMIGDEELSWPNLHTVRTKSGIDVFCNAPTNRMVENGLEKVFNHEYSAQERFWVLPEQHKRTIDIFKRPWPDANMPVLSKSAQRSVSRSTPKPDGEMISVSDICMQLGIKPRDGRSALRKSNFEKPAYGWQFLKDSDEYEKVSQFLREAKS